MRFSLLSGAVKNAGDFLIVERTKQLLEYVYPHVEFQEYNRKESITDYLDEINKTDALIFAGGPLILPEMYPKEMPLTEDLTKIKVPLCTIGLGWYGKNNLESTIYENYKLSESTIKLVESMERDSAISCRDWYTVRLLKNQGIENSIMTGCPAWYDIPMVHCHELRTGICIPYKKICISDPGYSINLEKSYEIAKYLREEYPIADIYYIFHRGIGEDANTTKLRGDKNERLVNSLEKIGIHVCDISYSAKGFDVYDDCDIHIGFRVHAHIYNLSKRNISILIEEDGRGIGVDEALGLYGIKPYHFRRNTEIMCDELIDNKYYIQNLQDYLLMLEKNNYSFMEQAYCIQDIYFERMIKHLKHNIIK